MFVPPAWAMRLRLVSELPTPMTKVLTGGFAASPLAATVATSWTVLALQPDGSPSVASTTMVFLSGCAAAQGLA